MSTGAPHGYERLALLGADVIVREELVPSIRDALAASTLYAWAATHAQRTVLHGHLPAYVAPLPHGGPVVVVRRNQLSGALARSHRERFVRSRGPRELDVSLRLIDEGVPTPEILAYAIYRVRALSSRTDVVCRKLPEGRPLDAVLAGRAPDPLSKAQLAAVMSLLDRMAAIGAGYPGLTVANIYLTDGSKPRAYVIDVGRVRFTSPDKAAATNSASLRKSLSSWSRQRGPGINAATLTAIVSGFQTLL